MIATALEIFWMTVGLAASPSCKMNDSGVLRFGQYESKIEVVSPDAELIKCEIPSVDPKLLIVEASLGTAGTSSLTSETDLLLFKIEDKRLTQVFRKTIASKTESANGETAEMKKNYRLGRDSQSKKLFVEWKPSGKKEDLSGF